jgi:predicted nucleic acid-binding protein
VLRANFPHTRFLGPQSAAELLASLPGHGLAGGSVYDALVGAVAKEHRIPLGIRDRRAARTYRALEVEVGYVDGLGS